MRTTVRNIIEASELGWEPGHWPITFHLEHANWTKFYEQTTADEKEIISVTYKNDEESWQLLEVLND